jgi:hypothetical protein
MMLETDIGIHQCHAGDARGLLYVAHLKSAGDMPLVST